MTDNRKPSATEDVALLDTVARTWAQTFPGSTIPDQLRALAARLAPLPPAR